MAYSPITSALLSEVTNRVHSLRNAEIAQMGTEDTKLQLIVADTALKAHLIDKLWEKEPDLRERLQKYNVQGQLSATCEVTHTDYFEDDGVTPLKSTVRVELGKADLPVFTPAGDSYYNRFLATIPVSAEEYPLFKEVADIKMAIGQTNARWDKVREQVIKFLESCKSFNEAIKLWPDVVKYLPKEAIDRVNKKTEKASAKESSAMDALKALDMDAINTSNVLARMAGARI